MEKVKIFINLTNGIEAIPDIINVTNDINFIRIQSSHCERRKFNQILQDVDNNILMYLALGYECIVYDFAANSEVSKAVYTGLEWIRFVLYKRWFNIEYIPYIKGKKVKTFFDKYYKEIDYKLKRKIDYYKKYLNTNIVKLTGISKQTINDNKPEYFKNILFYYF